jgi:hypothetical protein
VNDDSFSRKRTFTHFIFGIYFVLLLLGMTPPFSHMHLLVEKAVVRNIIRNLL